MSKTYLDDEVLECLAVLGGVSIEVVRQAIDGKLLEVLNAGVPLLHLLKACLVVATGHHLTMVDLLVRHHLLVALLKLDELFLVDALALALALTLANDLNLEGFLVCVLSHHPLQLEGVAVQLHLFFQLISLLSTQKVCFLAIKTLA